VALFSGGRVVVGGGGTDGDVVAVEVVVVGRSVTMGTTVGRRLVVVGTGPGGVRDVGGTVVGINVVEVGAGRLVVVVPRSVAAVVDVGALDVSGGLDSVSGTMPVAIAPISSIVPHQRMATSRYR
jgi:hypothetical protein